MITEFCIRNGLIILSDEVYDRLSYSPVSRPATYSQEAANITLTVGSAGKSFFVTGWRIGWVIGPRHLIKHVTRAHIQICYSSVSPLQEAVAVALEEVRNGDHWPRSKADMKIRVNRFCAFFEDIGLQVSNLPWKDSLTSSLLASSAAFSP